MGPWRIADCAGWDCESTVADVVVADAAAANRSRPGVSVGLARNMGMDQIGSDVPA